MVHPADPDNSNRDELHDWTPWRGIRRAVVWGGSVAVLLAVVLAPVAWYAPYMVLNVWLRLALAFGVAWVLFGTVHRAAGMAGSACTSIVLVYVLLILLSNHVVFAVHGVPRPRGIAAGWQWCEPTALLWMNWIPLLGVCLCVALCHGGGAVGRSLLDILKTPMG